MFLAISLQALTQPLVPFITGPKLFVPAQSCFNKKKKPIRSTYKMQVPCMGSQQGEDQD